MSDRTISTAGTPVRHVTPPRVERWDVIDRPGRRSIRHDAFNVQVQLLISNPSRWGSTANYAGFNIVALLKKRRVQCKSLIGMRPHAAGIRSPNDPSGDHHAHWRNQFPLAYNNLLQCAQAGFTIALLKKR